MTFPKLLALIRISGTSKAELGRSQLASWSHDNCVPESPWAHSCLWASLKLHRWCSLSGMHLRDATLKETWIPLRIQASCRAPSLAFIRRKNLLRVCVGTACFLAPGQQWYPYLLVEPYIVVILSIRLLVSPITSFFCTVLAHWHAYVCVCVVWVCNK